MSPEVATPASAPPEAAPTASGPTAAPARAAMHVILDLDGTLLDTERLVQDASRTIVEGHGRTWTTANAASRLGKRPLEGCASVVAEFDLPCTPHEYLAQSITLLDEQWHEAKALPGAERLLKHLHAHGVPTALATSSPQRNLVKKLDVYPEWREMLNVIVCGDEVENGKPAPDIFLEAARRLGAEPCSCLVVEDAPAGVKAGKAACMQVVAVPSLPKKSDRPHYASADLILSSLLDLRLESWSLPPFEDWIEEALPIDPWYVKGPVIKGFGRGSKVLGIPTANLPTEAFSRQLADHVCGIYLGWAGLSDKGTFKMVMSVGWNPYFDNSEKTVEPWLLHEFPEDFYGEELRLAVVGYIRPEANFPSLDALVARIHRDGDIARRALDVPPFENYLTDPYLTTSLTTSLASKFDEAVNLGRLDGTI